MKKRKGPPVGGRRHTDRVRTAAVADAERMGVVDAAAKHGVGVSTLYEWRAAKRRDIGHERNTKPGRSPERRTESKRRGAKRVTEYEKKTVPVEVGRNVVKRYTPSQKAQAVEHARRHGVSAASKTHGVSRFTLYQWLRKAEAAAQGDAKEAVTTGPAHSEIEARRDAEIVGEYERHPGLGPSQVRNQLRRKGVKVSVHTVRRVMEGAGYRPPKVERRPHDRRYEAVRPNHLWHLDFVQRHINRASTFTLILLDDCSRFVTGHGVDDAERANMVLDTFERAVTQHGKPEMVMHDRGAAFWSWRGISRFTKLLTELGIDQVVAEHKEHNGKVENFNGNLAKELFDVHRFYDLAEMKRRLGAHLDWYNHVRTHHALGGLLVPADRYYGRAEQVLARIEAGAGKDHDELALGERRLSLFSVTSERGEVVVSLMGQRLRLSSVST